jgi:hypothetical protein
MEKSYVVILLIAAGLLIAVFGGFFFLNYTQFRPGGWEWEEITITNVEFEGTSGLENNSVVLYLVNTNDYVDAVLKQVQVLGDGFNRTLSIKPEDSNYPKGSQGQITLTDFGWMKNIEYEFRLISSTGGILGSIAKTP